MTRYLFPAYLLIINAAAFFLMMMDKFRAQKKLWRIPEATLMLFALLGGSVGALLGMYTFHHKTRKVKFFVGIPVILAVQVLLAVWLAGKF